MKNKKLLYLIIFVLFIWLIVLTTLFIETQNKDKENEINNYTVTGYSTDLSKVVDKNISSIVSIEQDGRVSTGFIYAQNDKTIYVVSSLHGVNDENSIDVYLHNGEKIKGIVKGSNTYLDIAVIECDCVYDVKPITFGDSKQLNNGEFVLAIGTNGNLQYDFSSAFGMIASKYREIENNVTYKDDTYNYNLGVIQLSGDFSSGYSGAPLFNMNGEVVGIIEMKDNNVTLAITSNEAKIVIDKIVNNEEYNRLDFGFTGKYINNLENYEAANLNIPVDVPNGYYVNNVRLNSLAYNSGISKGDIITNINDKEIIDIDSLLSIMYSGSETYSFTVIRNNEKLYLTGTIND